MTVPDGRLSLLQFVGSTASEAPTVIEVRKLLTFWSALADVERRRVWSLPPTASLEIHALQRAATVGIQKSLRGGSG